MEKVRVHQRWMALPWGVFCLIIAAVMGVGGAYSAVYYPQEKPSVRVVIPAYGLALYWVFALLANRRTVTVEPDGLRVSIWPFVVRLPQRVRRKDVRFCYIRRIDVSDDETLLERHYAVGVETFGGEQIEISSPHGTAEDAVSLANRIAHTLNGSPGPAPVEVREIDQILGTTEALWVIARASFWLALFIAAIFAGFAWEESEQGDRARLHERYTYRSRMQMAATTRIVVTSRSTLETLRFECSMTSGLSSGSGSA